MIMMAHHHCIKAFGPITMLELSDAEKLVDLHMMVPLDSEIPTARLMVFLLKRAISAGLRLACICVCVQHLPESACTLNLHLVVCHLSQQEAARGAVAKDAELWIERDTQRMKELSRYQLTAKPEVGYVNGCLLDQALTAVQSSNSGAEGVL